MAVQLVIVVLITNKKVMADLKNNESRYRYLFENANDPIFELDLKGNFSNINNIGIKLTGYSKKEFIGKHFSKIVYPQDLPIALEVFQQLLKGNEVNKTISLRIVRKDKSLIDIEYKVFPHYSAGQLVGIHGLARDVTEENLMRKQLQHNRQLIQLGSFVASIAHQIRNPLFGISNIAQIITKNFASKESAELSEAMLSEIERLDQLIKELLEFSKPRKIKLEKIDIAKMLKELLALYEGKFLEKNIKTKLVLTKDIKEAVSDEYLLRQIISNLLLNAAQFSKENSGITVKAFSKVINGEPRWKVIIHNRGKIIPKEKLSEIFEPFYSTSESGVGLGLAICKQFAVLLSGILEVKSNKKSGTEFSICLPVSGEGIAVKERCD